MKYNDFSFNDYQICSSSRLRTLIEEEFEVSDLASFMRETEISDLQKHLQLIFDHGMLPTYTFDSPEVREAVSDIDNYRFWLRYLAKRVYEEWTFYENAYGRFDNAVTATTLSTEEFIMQLTLVIFSSESSQIIKSKNGWESKTAKYARCYLPNCINIASIQTRKDYYTYLWLISCIEQYLRLDSEGLSKFWYTHKLREAKEGECITVTRRMVNSLFGKQAFIRDGLFEPGIMFNLQTPLPEPNQIFYQIMESAKESYLLAKI